jgi:hypothetical protein
MPIIRQGSKKKAAEIFTSLGKMSADDQEIVRIIVRNYLDVPGF